MANPATSSIDTPTRAGDAIVLPVEASTLIYRGTIAARNAAGNLVPAADAAGLVVLGRCGGPDNNAVGDVDNSQGEAGDISGRVDRGIFAWNNSTAHPITAANIGQVAFCEDDNTVGTDPGVHGVRAGVIVEVDEDGVWIDTRLTAMVGAVAVALTSSAAAISALTFTADGATGAEVRALATACAAIAADVAAIKAALNAQAITS